MHVRNKYYIRTVAKLIIMTATFNYQNQKIQIKFDPITSHIIVTVDGLVLKYIEITEAMFDEIDFRNYVNRIIQNLGVQPQYS